MAEGGILTTSSVSLPSPTRAGAARARRGAGATPAHARPATHGRAREISHGSDRRARGDRQGRRPTAPRGAADVQTGACSPVGRVGGARGRERAGPTRSHPEPGRDPAQRRRVLRGRPHGRRGRRGRPPPPAPGAAGRPAADDHNTRRGVEQRQLVGLITQRSGVRIPPPLPRQENDAEQTARGPFLRALRSSPYANKPSCWTASGGRRPHVRAHRDGREEGVELRIAGEETRGTARRHRAAGAAGSPCFRRGPTPRLRPARRPGARRTRAVLRVGPAQDWAGAPSAAASGETWPESRR